MVATPTTTLHLAALSLWAVLVPQAFAYAQLAGMSSATGLYTALGAMIG
ncbi:SulP family inorganic anion transporter [Streptosporangium sp. NPDC051023]